MNEGARALSEALKTNTTLQSLDLEGEQDESDEDGWIADIANNKHQQADNKIGAEGISALSEALKTNATLQSLNLESGQEESDEDGWISDTSNKQNKQADNRIGAEGAGALSDALKVNTTLQTLNLKSEQESTDDGQIADIANSKHQQTGNEIEAEGARALSEALKTNTTLQSLNLESGQEESDEDGWISDTANNQNKQADNKIGAEGISALSEALKMNTTLQTLNLESEQEESVEDGWISGIAQ